MDQRAAVHSCFQTLIDTAIVVMRDTLWLFFAKIDLSAMQILCYSRIPETLFIMISQTIIYRRVAERNEIYRHSFKNESLFVKTTVTFYST